MKIPKSSKVAELNEQGSLYIDAGNYTEAIKCFEKAKEIDPCNMDAYINLGIAYASQESFDKAYEEFKGWFNTRDEKLPYSNI